MYSNQHVQPMTCTDIRQKWGSNKEVLKHGHLFQAKPIRDLCCVQQRYNSKPNPIETTTEMDMSNRKRLLAGNKN